MFRLVPLMAQQHRSQLSMEMFMISAVFVSMQTICSQTKFE